MRKDKQDDLDFIDVNDNHSQDGTLLADILTTILHHKKLFIFSIVICVLIGFIYVRSTPKNYSREAIVMVKDEKKGRISGETAAFEDMFSFGSNSVDNEIAFFKSKRLMQRVVERLNLDISYKVRDGLRKSELYTSSPFTITFIDVDPKQTISFTATLLDETMMEVTDMIGGSVEYSGKLKVQIGDTADMPIGKIVVAPTQFMDKDYIGNPVYVNKRNLKSVSDNYNNRLNVEIRQQSAIIRMTIADESSKRAEDVLNTLIEVYEKDVIDDKNRIAISTSDFIKARLIIIEYDLGIVDAEIENYKKKNRLTDITSESALFIENSGRLDSEGLSVENQLNMAEYMKEYLHGNSTVTNLIPASIGINNDGIQNQINEYNVTVAKRNRLIANSSANNPIVQELNRTLKSMHLSILNAVDNLIVALKIQVVNMKKKERENVTRIADVPTQQKYVISIERQQKIKEELYLYLLNKKEENDLQLSITVSNCRIVDPASGAVSPVSPNKAQVLLLSIVLGCLIPALYLYLCSLLNTRVYTKKEIKEGVNIPFLGEIPLEKQKRAKDIVVREGNREHICEAFKILRDNLDFVFMENKSGCKVIQVTSLNTNSGKTFITINLAISMALSNVKVIVLDLDLRKGSLTKKSGIGTKQKGLSCYLCGKENHISNLIRPYDENYNFDIITSGALPPNPAELLKSDRLEQLIAELGKDYDYILLDNPPYGIIVDVSLCTRVAHQTLFIIRSGLFDKRLFPELQEIYDSQKMRNLSVVLNAVNYVKVGYGYGYSYGYSYGEDEKKSRKETLYKRLLSLFHRANVHIPE